MKPYLREKNIKGVSEWKQDYHPPRGYINWWEELNNFISRKKAKQQLNKLIKDNEQKE